MIKIAYLAHQPDAVPVVARWLHDEWSHLAQDGSFETAIAKVQDRVNVDHMPLCFLAILDARPIGTASLVETEDPMDPYGPWVSSVYVLPEHRGRGIGSLLTRRVEEEAIRLGATRLLLSAAVPQLYAKFGYERTGALKNDEPIMAKSLTQHTK